MPKGVDAIPVLETPLTFGKRMALKYLVPRARAAVGRREFGKSLAVQMNNEFKRAYAHLGQLLVKEALLPDADLLYFVTHDEIRQLLRPGPGARALVAHAMRRREIHAPLSALQFPSMNKGMPQPQSSEQRAAAISSRLSSSMVVEKRKRRLADDGEEEEEDCIVEMTGMPVSRGVVRGRARVATTIAEASDMRKGEILIVPYTDIGWTVYFPLAAGLATELGGLLSHGAVCAREYGIPCIVNLAGATRIFQTGDEVEINGAAGTLRKLRASD